MDMTQYAGKESNYLKAADLQGKTPNVLIEGVELVEFDDDKGGKQIKPALALKGKNKKLVLNATNTETLMRKFGSDSEDWVGKSIMLSTHYYAAFDKEGLVVTALDTEGLDQEIPF